MEIVPFVSMVGDESAEYLMCLEDSHRTQAELVQRMQLVDAPYAKELGSNERNPIGFR